MEEYRSMMIENSDSCRRQLREKCVEMHEKGFKPVDIYRSLNVTRTFYYNALKAKREEDDIELKIAEKMKEVRLKKVKAMRLVEELKKAEQELEELYSRKADGEDHETIAQPIEDPNVSVETIAQPIEDPNVSYETKSKRRGRPKK